MAKTLKELLAEKRAAEAAARKEPVASNIETQVQVAAIIQNREQEKKEEVAAPAVEKPMTFMEKMALRKKLAEEKKPVESPAPAAKPLVEEPAPIPALADTGILDQTKQIDKDEALRTGQLVETLDAHPPVKTEASTETQQAYADIKTKIEQLESLEDQPLEGAMKELKKALMANPNAVELMLDTDIGKMVIALRRITREAQVEAAKEKKPGRKAKANAPLSAESLAEVYDDL